MIKLEHFNLLKLNLYGVLDRKSWTHGWFKVWLHCGGGVIFHFTGIISNHSSKETSRIDSQGWIRWPIVFYLLGWQVLRYLGCCNVSTNRTKTLCECSHHDVNVISVNAIIIRNTSTIGTHCTNTVSFIQIKVARPCSLIAYSEASVQGPLFAANPR